MSRLKSAMMWILGAVAMLQPCGSSAGNPPPPWPWRGVAIDINGGADERDIPRLAAAGANSVELVLSVRNTAAFNKLPVQAAWERNLAWAEHMLDACKLNGMVGIVTFVQVPLDPALGLTQESPEFWDKPAMRQEAVRLAGVLAQRFHGRGAELAAYEILSEPLVVRPDRQERPEAWPELLNSIIGEIRRYDPRRYIVVTPGPGGEPSGYKNFAPLADRHLVYGAHMYNPHSYTHQGIGGRPMGSAYPGFIQSTYWDKARLENVLAPVIAFKKKYAVPVWVGEFSAVRWAKGSEQYLADLIDIFDANGLGWAYFNYKGYHGWDPFYDEGYSTDKQGEWQSHFVGEDTGRWVMLKKALYGRRPLR